MIRVTVRSGDGLGEREWLRSVVARAQAGLRQAGETLQADGLFEPLTTPEQFAAMQTVVGLTRQTAQDALDANATLRSIRIGREQAEGLMAFTAKPYWIGIGGAVQRVASAGHHRVRADRASVARIQPWRAEPGAGAVAGTARREPLGGGGRPHRPDAAGAAHFWHRDQTARRSVYHPLGTRVSGRIGSAPLCPTVQ